MCSSGVAAQWWGAGGCAARQALCVAVAALVVAALVHWLVGRRSRLPPGPTGLPVVGYLPWVTWGGGGPLRTFARLARRYGPVWSMRMGRATVVVLSDYGAVKEALLRGAHVFSDRAPPRLLADLTGGALGLAHSNMPLLGQLRKLSLTALRGCGVGKKSLEQRLHEEIRTYRQELARARHQAEPGQDLREITTGAVSNVICSIVFGQRYDYDDPGFVALGNMMAENFSVSQTGTAFIFMPFLRHVPSLKKTVTLMQTNFKKIMDFVSDRIREHRESFDPENPRDLIDMYLKAQLDEAGRSDVNDITHYTSDAQMVKVILDLFFAGTETTSTTLLWAYLYMALHPAAQARCRAEIRAACGAGERLPSQDAVTAGRMVYTEATLMEVQRMGDIAPFAIMHCARQRTKFRGYDIPQGAHIVPHLHYLHRDPKYWSNPDEFNPSRFIDSDGKLISKCDSFLPFSIGRRVCLGEALARMELFLFFTAVLQSFSLRLAEGERERLPDMEGRLGLTRSPHPYRILLTPV